MCQLRQNIWFSWFAATLLCCGTQLSNRIALGADTLADPNQEATTLVARMLEANRPWLIPSPIQGTYFLLRKPGETGDSEVTGPFALESKRTNTVQWTQRISRVGSIVWTPLHNMIQVVRPYSLRMVGRTNWNDMNLIAVDVTFRDPQRCAVGFGGQGDVNYSSCDYRNQNARILIEPTNAVPILIETSLPAGPTTGSGFEATWRFDTTFFSIQGGFAPQAVEWYDPTSFRERQEFQIHQQEWLFKRGDAWWGEKNLWGPTSGLIQSFELIDLTLADVSKLAIEKSGGNITLSWPTYGRSGVVLESARGVEGSWSTLLSSQASDITDVSVTLPVNQSVQFYRLRR